METLKNNNGIVNMGKVFELRYKDSNDIISTSISEMAIRKEYLSMKEDGENVENLFVQENFMPIPEWNNAMNSAFKK